ncbi:teichoic acid glycerol-phosphate primase TarB [Staphylococcus caprae]|uniref:Teichoic acid biosynthesis protein B, TagB n=2 Tax=Staphylococcus TaxID=1279 RepID=A0ABN5WC75_9STAP|nr:teichoic acid glycerol-phosphate primase TarB [Staphylococcus caprae]MBN6824818.1 CDP-glycerol glycerophosphotransferase family protein [Staphylococcus caprae]MBX5316357.1 CDP-glycerol glycerophosphotransferase family protein [Staphylococcus caprae]MBX5322089.1 CDP-glycerol glycerophosphotransferase family protein [Staphylococcus caprae]MDI0014949.1 CDP-glycerol glycerophosphotransferase family protein [Staphylococcus caprae]MEB8093678.1 CDP-glycerol glycerophosphotransferase family protein
MRILIKKVYMIMITLLNMIYKPLKLKRDHIVVMMTFKQDVLPIIEALHQQGYHLTIIGKIQDHSLIEGLENTTFIPAGNKNIVSHMKALSTAKVIVIDTYYLMMGGYHKKKGQTVIQTWHASGALKDFGLTDHQVDLNNKAMVEQYKRVYNATDYYLVGGDEMARCFEASFEAQPEQMLKFGLPRLVKYLNMNIEKEQQRLKEKYHIKNKLAVYVPTYRESKVANRTINKEIFEQQLPEYTLMSHLHPSISERDTSQDIDVASLMVMADVIISDYSSLPIEASLLNKPTLFYNYDEEDYEKVRGLNPFYYEIPKKYKFADETSLIQALGKAKKEFQPLFHSWHQYNTKASLSQLVNFINKLVKQ